jgi:hypothetical protein
VQSVAAKVQSVAARMHGRERADVLGAGLPVSARANDLTYAR